MLNKDFLSGHYQKNISRSLSRKDTSDSSEIVSLIGSLCFSGELLEAKKRYKEAHPKLSSKERAICRFFLGLAYTRKSQYQKAAKIFKINLRSLSKTSDHLERFYVYQGIAFYLFFLGKFELSMKWVLKSFDSAIDSNDLYARSLSTDLLAHIKLRLGEINVGLELLKSADKLSLKIGNKSVSAAIESAELQYRAHYGYDRGTIVSSLEEKFNELVSEDNYSRAAIGLELARQYTLRGQFDLASIILEKISSNIFATENRRQEIQLNLRFAENYYQMGKTALAWNYVRSARRCLNFEADKSFEIQIMGFEHKLFDEASKKPLENELIQKSRHFNNMINHNILSRQHIGGGELLSHEDLYHDFLMSLKNEEDKISKIIDSGYYSLLVDVMEVKRGEAVLYFDQQMNRVILFSGNKIEVSKTHLTPTEVKILLAILLGAGEKSQICKHVWGYDYDPLRHDNIIYTGVRSLRKNLGNGGAWIETTENGYRLSSERKFKIYEQAHTNKVQNDPIVVESVLNALNLRQVKALKYLDKNESLDVLSYQKIFQVSDVTASRDLRALKNLGYVISIGKARATKYLKRDL